MKNTTRQISRFARHILGKPLYPYQAEVAEAVLDSILGEHGRIITVMMARQTGKNQLSAVIEVYLLTRFTEGSIVNVVGATADLLLEIDEAQDVAPEKFDRDFRPMAAVKKPTFFNGVNTGLKTLKALLRTAA